jgi:hypothetical protein
MPPSFLAEMQHEKVMRAPRGAWMVGSVVLRVLAAMALLAGCWWGVSELATQLAGHPGEFQVTACHPVDRQYDCTGRLATVADQRRPAAVSTTASASAMAAPITVPAGRQATLHSEYDLRAGRTVPVMYGDDARRIRLRATKTVLESLRDGLAGTAMGVAAIMMLLLAARRIRPAARLFAPNSRRWYLLKTLTAACIGTGMIASWICGIWSGAIGV